MCISTSEQVLLTTFASQNQFFNAKTTFCVLFSHKMYKITKNHVLKGGLHTFFCLFCMILSGFPLIFCLFCSISDGKSCFSFRKSISTREWRTDHPFAGWNTQHSGQISLTTKHLENYRSDTSNGESHNRQIRILKSNKLKT